MFATPQRTSQQCMYLVKSRLCGCEKQIRPSIIHFRGLFGVSNQRRGRGAWNRSDYIVLSKIHLHVPGARQTRHRWWFRRILSPAGRIAYHLRPAAATVAAVWRDGIRCLFSAECFRKVESFQNQQWKIDSMRVGTHLLIVPLFGSRIFFSFVVPRTKFESCYWRACRLWQCTDWIRSLRFASTGTSTNCPCLQRLPTNDDDGDFLGTESMRQDTDEKLLSPIHPQLRGNEWYCSFRFRFSGFWFPSGRSFVRSVRITADEAIHVGVDCIP